MLSKVLSSSAIREANKAIRSAAMKQPRTPEQQAEVASYTSMHGIKAAQCRFLKQFQVVEREYSTYLENKVPGRGSQPAGRIMGVVPRGNGTKIKTTKISSGAFRDDSAKFCTNKNFPLYGMRLQSLVIIRDGIKENKRCILNRTSRKEN